MSTIYLDSTVDDDVRRERLYGGDLFIYGPRPSTRALCKLARELAEEAFAPLDPRDAQHELDVERFGAILADLKPRFIHHPEAKTRIREILRDLRCDLERTYFDVPRLRTVTHGGYLTAGLGYAFKPHRDTWYSTPMCQLNWWLPVYELESSSSMTFHTPYWTRPLANSSREFNYQEWNRVGRRAATDLTSTRTDTRRQSEAEEPIDNDPQLRIVCEPGGLILFSGAQLHSTTPNESGHTRFSIDFRTVHLDELRENGGAPNLDSASTGTTIRDYLRGTDLAQVPDSVLALFEDAPPAPDERSPQFR